MTSIMLKKRKLYEAIEEGLRVTPASNQVKMYLDENGQHKNLYESIIPQLKALFPEQSVEFIMETLKYHKCDILCTIEFLKYQKAHSTGLSPKNKNKYVDQDILDIIDRLSKCSGYDQTYNILADFKRGIMDASKIKSQRPKAENTVLRKAFNIQKKVLSEENHNRIRSELILRELMRDLEKSKSIGNMINIRLNELEKICFYNLRNNHIF